MSLATTAAVVGIAGTAYGVYDSVTSDSGGGGGGNGLQPIFDPFFSDLTNLGSALFGTGSPNGPGQEAIADFLFNPIPITPAERASARFFGADRKSKTTRGFNAPFLQLVNEAEGFIRDDIFPGARELATTGRPTDLQPIIDREVHRLRTETAPELAARFGQDIAGTGFANALNQSGEDLGFNLGALQVGADEAATSRFADFIGSGAAERIFQLPLNLRSGAAVLQGNQGQLFRERSESTRPGSRLAGFLPTLSNALSNSAGFIQQGAAPDSGGTIGSVLGALGPLLGALGGGGGGTAGGVSSLAGLFGGTGGGNAAGGTGGSFVDFNTANTGTTASEIFQNSQNSNDASFSIFGS